MPEREDLLTLIAELDADIELLDALVGKNAEALSRIDAGAIDELDYAALGYTIHNLYSLIEGYAVRIAKTFENHVDGETWHQDLVRRMRLEIPGIRPAVWDSATAGHIDELRRFRHAFRHVYESGLDARKLLLAEEHVQPSVAGLTAAHAVLLRRLQALADELD
ncbi:MAG: hypothetical protein ACOC6J_03315 [Spirochaetota bacterium]